jgi:hypothetical protein
VTPNHFEIVFKFNSTLIHPLLQSHEDKGTSETSERLPAKDPREKSTLFYCTDWCLTNFTEHYPSWGAKNRSYRSRNSPHLWIPNTHCRLALTNLYLFRWRHIVDIMRRIYYTLIVAEFISSCFDWFSLECHSGKTNMHMLNNIRELVIGHYVFVISEIRFLLGCVRTDVWEL